jgi:OTU domain-containing protein 7
VNLVTKARKEFAMDFHVKAEQTSPFIDTPDYTFTLPDLTLHDEEFRKFLEKDLIECSTLNSLESSSRLNWWVDLGVCRKVWPLSTSGDGNCLLHAASLAMWGFHDRRLTLRKALHNILSEGEFREVLWRRWRFQQTRVNKEAGLVFSETEWAKEWDEIVALASAEPRNNKNAGRRRSMVLEKQTSLTTADSIDASATYDSLEEIHVLALAYVLRRPIIVISDIVLRDINGEALAPVTFGGVYLPLDVPQSDCHKVPLLLAYDTAHFSALVTMESANEFPPALIPLIDCENILLPIQFCIDPGTNFTWRDYDGREGNWALTEVEHIALLKEYLEISYASPAASPEDEIYEDYQSDEEYDRKMMDIAVNLDSGQLSPESEAKKSKAAKLQSVAKQFGSIGKSMSKKIKKNIGSIAKFARTPVKTAAMTPTMGGGYVNGKYRLLCAQLRAKRHDYQEEMIRNYLDCAYERFIHRDVSATVPATSEPRIVHCINSGCENFGTETKSWMCSVCYEKQKQQENCSSEFDYAPRYGTGNSKFYTQSDANSHNVVKRLPSVKKLSELDQTLYLSKSTFFNDTKAPPHNQIGIPLSPTTTGKTTIIPIRVEGRDEADSKDLMQFDSLPPQYDALPVRKSYDLAKKCRTPDCGFFGNPDYCSKCSQKQKMQAPQQQYRKLQTEI